MAGIGRITKRFFGKIFSGVRPEPKQAVFLTYNVAGLKEPNDGTEFQGDDPEIRESRAAIARTISQGDVVALQEVRSAESLERFVQEFGLEEQFPHRHFFKTRDRWGNHQAILSRFPMSNFETHSKGTEGTRCAPRMTREIAEAEVQLGAYPTKVYSVHLKANPYFANNPTPEEMAKAERRRLLEQNIVSQRIAEDGFENYAVLGDFNDDTGSPTTEAFLSDSKVPLVDPHQNLSGPDSHSHPVTERRMDGTYLSPSLASKVVESSALVLQGNDSESDHRAVKVVVDLR